MSLSFFEKLTLRHEAGHFVCFGYDPVYDRIPATCLLYGKTVSGRKKEVHPQELANFCTKLIEPTAEVAGCFKPNIAFFERYGSRGFEALENIIAQMKRRAPHIPIILDAKRADIGKTNEGYAEYAFDYLKVDAITVHNYLGHVAMEPFLRHADKGIIVLCKTSNPGSDEFQNMMVYHDTRLPLYLQVAEHVADRKRWNVNGNCSVVVGATYPEELERVRTAVGDMPILIPGIGAQGGDLVQAVHLGMNRDKLGFIINTSSGAMFASDGADHVDATVANLTEVNTSIIEARAG